MIFRSFLTHQCTDIETIHFCNREKGPTEDSIWMLDFWQFSVATTQFFRLDLKLCCISFSLDLLILQISPCRLVLRSGQIICDPTIVKFLQGWQAGCPPCALMGMQTYSGNTQWATTKSPNGNAMGQWTFYSNAGNKSAKKIHAVYFCSSVLAFLLKPLLLSGMKLQDKLKVGVIA